MHAKALSLAALSMVAAFAAPWPAHAQSVPSAPAAEKKPSPSGVKAYEAGTKAFESGKYAPAIQSYDWTVLTLDKQPLKVYRGVEGDPVSQKYSISDLSCPPWKPPVWQVMVTTKGSLRPLVNALME